ncbi:MAG TPA: glycoside hydrolase family 28 protein [Candidatus Dormibacteraeota bacterium]|nr:glycoside hydrolase family 28 protein [Candidatus Dormibacteraeota bacterium]
MRLDEPGRRKFLKSAGLAAIAAPSAALVPKTPTSAGQNAAEMGHPGNPSQLFFDVRAFGATGDGKALDTSAINRAIESASRAGGGTVYLRAGNYLCYSIHLKSKVSIFLDQGATIVAADPAADTAQSYDPAESNKPWEEYQDYGHNHWRNSLIWGEGLEDISICGPGLIWGKGLSRGWGDGPVAEHAGVANKAIALKNCRNVLLRDFSILHGGHFGILATGVDNFAIDNVKIDTNRDGMDIDCCRNVRVSNCSVNSPWDDGICLKSSFALGYARATEMVTISNCLLSGSYEEGTLLDGTWRKFPAGEKVQRTGRIKFGTESNGGFKNITVSNCVFDGCRGLAIESVDGAVIEDVTCTNITMRDVFEAPIFIRLGARMRGPAGVPVGTIRRVLLSGISCVQAEGSPKIACILAGIPGHAIEDVKISDVIVVSRGGGTKSDAEAQVPEKEKQYPEPNMFGTTPSHGFFIRHARGLEMQAVKIECSSPDERPVFTLEDVQDATFGRMKVPVSAGVPTFVLNQVKDFSVFRSKPVKDTELAAVEKAEI